MADLDGVKAIYPGYEDNIYDILSRGSAQWTDDETRIIQKLVQVGDRERLRAINQALMGDAYYG